MSVNTHPVYFHINATEGIKTYLASLPSKRKIRVGGSLAITKIIPLQNVKTVQRNKTFKAGDRISAF